MPETVLVAPAHHWCPVYDRTLGPEVADLADSVEMSLDGNQRAALADMFGLRAGGLWTVTEDATVCDRQNLKTHLLEAAAQGKMALGLDMLTVWTAHEYPTAIESFRRIKSRFTDYDHMSRLVRRVYEGKGDESIELTSGARMIFRARTKHGGRGLSGDTVVLDEAQKLTAANMGAIVPTISTRRRAQLLYGGTAGDVSAEVWRTVRDRGRAGGARRLAYREWCAEWRPCGSDSCTHTIGSPGCALDDRELWLQANPSLDMPGRVRSEVVETERATMPPGEFMRERLGWWQDPPGGGGVLDLEVWAALATGVQDMVSPVFSLEVALDRAATTIGAVWDVDGLPHAEVVEDGPGVGWVVARMVELTERYGGPGVVVDTGTEAAGLVEMLNGAGLTVLPVNGTSRTVACGDFYDLATTAGMTHSGDPAITAAIGAARWKDVGDGARAFTRRRSAGNIAALYAVVLALWGRRHGDEDYDLMASIG